MLQENLQRNIKVIYVEEFKSSIHKVSVDIFSTEATVLFFLCGFMINIYTFSLHGACSYHTVLHWFLPT